MRSLAAVILTLSGLSLAACGSSHPSSSGTQKATSDASNVTKANKALAFAECMRSHGVPNFPDPTGGKLDLSVQKTPNGTTVNGVQVNGPAFQSAMQSCHADLPNGGQPAGAASPSVRAAALKFSQCMRSHGVPNFPDLQVSGSNGHVQMRVTANSGSGFDPNSPAFKAAQQKCQPLISHGLGGGAAVTGSG